MNFLKAEVYKQGKKLYSVCFNLIFLMSLIFIYFHISNAYPNMDSKNIMLMNYVFGIYIPAFSILMLSLSVNSEKLAGNFINLISQKNEFTKYGLIQVFISLLIPSIATATLLLLFYDHQSFMSYFLIIITQMIMMNTFHYLISRIINIEASMLFLCMEILIQLIAKTRLLDNSYFFIPPSWGIRTIFYMQYNQSPVLSSGWLYLIAFVILSIIVCVYQYIQNKKMY
ncbi:hypothetical protein JOC36_000949 [Weissella uvarum]|nr:hypothetical protein [Weissella uvarum]